MRLLIERLSTWLCALSLLVACTQESETDGVVSTGSGFLLSLSDLSIQTDESANTRAVPSELEKPVAENFHLTILPEGSTQPLYDGTFTSEPIPAGAGSYTLTARYGSNPTLAWDSPYYEGSAEATVTESRYTPVTIPCRVANALLSVRFSNPDLFSQLYSSYGVAITHGDYTLEITPTNTNQSAYFPANAPVSISFYGFFKDAGRVVSTVLNDKNLTFDAGTHTIITLSSAGPTSGIACQIEKVEIETVSINQTLPVKWLPKPKVTATGFTNNQLSMEETQNCNATLGATISRPLEDVKLTLSFEDSHLSQYNGSYLLSNEQDKSLLAETLGLSLPSLGDNECVINVSPLIEQIQTNDGITTSNSIEIDVKANDRWSSEDTNSNRTFTIICNAPNFAVTVDERKSWSREFTIEEIVLEEGSKANIEKLKSDLIYQYYDGSSWIECTDRQSVKGRLQQFSQSGDALSSKSYTVRALYRHAVPSSTATAVLEAPAQMPNSDMEDWYGETYNSNGSPKLMTFYPWAQGGESYWSTNNEFTTRYRQSTFAYPYNSFLAVSSVPASYAHHGNRAAELRNTASGLENTVVFGKFNVRTANKVPGILFTGTFSAKTGSTSNDDYTKTDGRDFSVRPTAMHFWYKYAPYTTDTWSAHIELWDENKQIIAQGHMESSDTQSSYKEGVIELNYNPSVTYNKCKFIYVIFSSSIHSGDEMPYETAKSTYTIWNGDSELTYKEAHIGSVLHIDDISLIYEK